MDVLLLKPGETVATRVDLRATHTIQEILECLKVQGHIHSPERSHLSTGELGLGCADFIG